MATQSPPRPKSGVTQTQRRWKRSTTRQAVYANDRQLVKLREFYGQTARPTNDQKIMLGRETGLDPKWITGWFKRMNKQTKRPQFRSVASTVASDGSGSSNTSSTGSSLADLAPPSPVLSANAECPASSITIRRVALDDTVPVDLYRTHAIHPIPLPSAQLRTGNSESFPSALSISPGIAAAPGVPSLAETRPYTPCSVFPTLFSTADSSIYTRSAASSQQATRCGSTSTPAVPIPHDCGPRHAMGSVAYDDQSIRGSAFVPHAQAYNELSGTVPPNPPQALPQQAVPPLPSIYSLLFDESLSTSPDSNTLPPLSHGHSDGIVSPRPMHYTTYLMREPFGHQLTSHFESDDRPSGLTMLEEYQKHYVYGIPAPVTHQDRLAVPVAFQTRYEDLMALERRVRSLYDDDCATVKKGSSFSDDGSGEQNTIDDSETDMENQPALQAPGECPSTHRTLKPEKQGHSGSTSSPDVQQLSASGSDSSCCLSDVSLPSVEQVSADHLSSTTDSSLRTDGELASRT